MGEIGNKYQKSKIFQFIKKTDWILPHIVKGTPISGPLHSTLMQINQERPFISQER